MNDADFDRFRGAAQRVAADARALRESAVGARERARQVLRDDQERRLRMRAARSSQRGRQRRVEPGPVPSLSRLGPTAREDATATRRFRIEIDTASPPTTTVRVHGELDLATTGELDSTLVAELISRHITAPLLIDLAAVGFVSVGALRGLLDTVDEAKRRGARVEIVERSPAVLTMLALTDLENAPTPLTVWPPGR